VLAVRESAEQVGAMTSRRRASCQNGHAVFFVVLLGRIWLAGGISGFLGGAHERADRLQGRALDQRLRGRHRCGVLVAIVADIRALSGSGGRQ